MEFLMILTQVTLLFIAILFYILEFPTGPPHFLGGMEAAWNQYEPIIVVRKL